MKGMEGKLDTVVEQVELMRKEREVKWWPIILGIISIVSFISTANAVWVNLRLEPIKIKQATSDKDFDRLYDNFKKLEDRVAESATKAYVDEKASYLYHDLKGKIPPKSP